MNIIGEKTKTVYVSQRVRKILTTHRGWSRVGFGAFNPCYNGTENSETVQGYEASMCATRF